LLEEAHSQVTSWKEKASRPVSSDWRKQYSNSRSLSSHSKRGLVKLQHRLGFLPLGLIHVAQPDQRSHRLRVEAGALGLGEHLLDVVGDGLLFFHQALD